MDQKERKENNIAMIKSTASMGGFALSILTAFTLVTIGAMRLNTNKKAKEDSDYGYKLKADKFIHSLTYIANKQYQKYLGVDTVSNYVWGISSITFSGNQSITYMAYAQMHDVEKESLILINFYFNNQTVEQNVDTIIKNRTDVSDYLMGCYILNEVEDEATNQCFEKYIADVKEESSTNIKYTFKTYRKSEADSNTYVSATYQYNDKTYFSYHSMKYENNYDYLDRSSGLSGDGTMSLDRNRLTYYIAERIVDNTNK